MGVEKKLFKDKGEKIKNLFGFFDVKLGEKIEVLVEKKGEYNWEKGEVLGADTDKEELIIKFLNGEVISLNKGQKSNLEKDDEEEIEEENDDKEEEDDEEEEEITENYINSLPPEKRKYFKKKSVDKKEAVGAGDAAVEGKDSLRRKKESLLQEDAGLVEAEPFDALRKKIKDDWLIETVEKEIKDFEEKIKETESGVEKEKLENQKRFSENRLRALNNIINARNLDIAKFIINQSFKFQNITEDERFDFFTALGEIKKTYEIWRKEEKYKDIISYNDHIFDISKNAIALFGFDSTLGFKSDGEIKVIKEGRNKGKIGGIIGVDQYGTLNYRLYDDDPVKFYIILNKKDAENEISKVQEINDKKTEIAGGKKEIEVEVTERIRKLEKEIENYSLIYETEIKNSELASQELKKEIFEGLEKYKREVEELKLWIKIAQKV